MHLCVLVHVCVCVKLDPHLWGVDSSLLEGAVAGVLRAHVAIFAPVTGEVSVNTGQAPGVSKKKEVIRFLFINNEDEDEQVP